MSNTPIPATLPCCLPSQPPQLATPTLNTVPTPTKVTLGTTSVTLKDTADLENGFRPTGAITFTLVAPGGGTVDTETVRSTATASTRRRPASPCRATAR
jgi:hypothetical protein